VNNLLALCAIAAAGCTYNHPFEVCNGLDDDDNPNTLDGLEDERVGEPCDGPDADLCPEGSIVCSQGALACNDSTTDSLEVCNEEDDDCNGIVDDGFDTATDPLNCGSCETACTNANGTTECTAGTCAPTCASGAVDCNNALDDGCEVFRDRNPTCMEAKEVGSINGDVTGGRIVQSGSDEAVFEFTLTEISTTATPVTAMITLDLPPGLDYDLIVRCQDCDSAIMSSSRNGPGITETVGFRHRDTTNVNDDQTVFVEIRFVSETTCGDNWELEVLGGVAVAAVTCGPV